MESKLYSFIGLMQKAGKLSSGDDSVEIDIKKGKTKLLIIAQDASENTKKKFENMARYRNIPYIFFGTKENIGLSIGKSSRAVLSIEDENFANGFLAKIEGKYNGGESIVKGKNI
jgi:ribosomal protein L7Ae-like RNA K-turn-binding protein